MVVSTIKRCNSNDWISELLDDILKLILTLLTLKEAAITSLLARRWRYLWASSISNRSNLNFDAEETLHRTAVADTYRDAELLKTERIKYVNWVNSVLSLYKGSNLHEFIVCFDLDNTDAHHIDTWIEFALSRRDQIQKLVLDFPYSSGGSRTCSVEMYNFPVSFLDQTNPSSFGDFKSLKTLCLNSVNATAQVVGYFLSLCPVLESLTVAGSDQFGNLTVAGPFLMLKFLELRFCMGIDTIEITDTNLVSFHYDGPKTNLVVKNVPMLVDVSYISDGLYHVVDMLTCCLNQLEILTLGGGDFKDYTNIYTFLEFPKVKHFTLHNYDPNITSLFPLISMIRAFPYLQSFVLLMFLTSRRGRFKREVRKAPKCPIQYLKVVELRGCCGCTTELEFAIHLFENAVALEKLILDPCSPHCTYTEYCRMPKGIKEIEYEGIARRITVQQFERKAPSGVELVIL